MNVFMLGGGIALFIALIGYIVYLTIFKGSGDGDGDGDDKSVNVVQTTTTATTVDTEMETEKKTKTGTVDPNGNVLRGYTTSSLVEDGRGMIKGNSMAACREIAKKYGYIGVGYRNDRHTDSNLKNTCFFYSKPESKWKGNSRDLANVSGCADASKTWPDCGPEGGVLPGWTRNNLVDVGAEEADSIEECRQRAKELEYIGVGYRTSENPIMENKDTCYYYDGTDSTFKGKFGDGGNVTGCTDATKRWPDC